MDKMLSNITYLIKKNGAGVVSLALIFMMVYSWFPKVERTVDASIEKVNNTLTQITKEFRDELKEQRKENRDLIERLIEKNAASQKSIQYQASNEHPDPQVRE